MTPGRWPAWSTPRMSIRTASPALAAALLFGASTPLAKLLVGTTQPVLLAGLLYLGSGLGLGLLRALRAVRGGTEAGAMPLPLKEVRWLPGAILHADVMGPALQMLGL